MTLLHQRLVEYAKQAIRAIFSDTTVSPEESLESLELLRGEINGWIEAIEEDMEGEEDKT